MVCAKCQKLAKSTTTLATPAVKKKSDMYYGSPASSSSAGSVKKPATLGQTGVTKSKLLSKAAKNPYAQYARSVLLVLYSGGKEISSNRMLAHVRDARRRCRKDTAIVTNALINRMVGAISRFTPKQRDADGVPACAICGKGNTKKEAAASLVTAQKFSLK
jgi:hypothetical protein